MIGKIGSLRQKILERRALDFFHFAGAAIARIEILLKERAKVDLFERVLLLRRRNGIFFSSDRALPLLFATSDIIHEGNRILQFLQNWILHHLAVDHVLKLKLVERKHADHLHEPGCKYLPLRYFEAQSVLQ